MNRFRIIAAMLVVGASAGAIAVIAGPKDPDGGPKAARTVPDCASCHSEIAREVRASYHGQAYTDPEVLELTKNFTDQSCISCHAPMPIYVTGINERVHARNERRETGVDCISCHLLPDGGVAGSRGLTDAPCRPVVKKDLKTATFCAGCHNQHWTVDEYAGSRWAETHTCNDCHMPRVDRPLADGGPVRKGVYTHGFPGGHDLETLKKGVTLDAEVSGREIVVRVTNSGSGHKVPTDSRHKSFNVVVTIRDAEGNLLTDQEEVAEYRLYYRESDLPSTQILPDETREHRVALPDGRKGKVTVQLVYCLKPPAKVDRTWTLVHELVLDF